MFHKPEGYKDLLVYRRAEELRQEILKLTQDLGMTERFGKIHLNDSARSVKQNIVEGWKRTTTYEYYIFLSYSLGSLGEIKEDIEDLYRDRKIDKLIYNTQINRVQELDFLLNRLQLSLKNKMVREGTWPQKEKYKEFRTRKHNEDQALDKILKEAGFKKLDNGQVVKIDSLEEK